MNNSVQNLASSYHDENISNENMDDHSNKDKFNDLI